MSYIGNAKSLIIIGSNVRDDIVPNGSSRFTLSQEVPGGYEGNITVIRKRYVVTPLVKNTTAISIVADASNSTSKLKVTSDSDLAAALSVVSAPATDADASNIIISGATNPQNNKTFRIVSVTYNGSTIEIEVKTALTSESGSSLSLSWGRTLDWEILEPERDYTIEGNTPETRNRWLVFQGGYKPEVNDIVYAIHKGEATYNLVPSDKSVGYDQLEDNLKDFLCETFLATGNSSYEYTLTRSVPNEHALLITVNGVVQHLSHENAPTHPPGGYDVLLLSTGDKFRFSDANHTPAAGAVIKVLHLGFTTGIRRAAFAPGQIQNLPFGSVTSAHLATNAVITEKIYPDAVDGSKILLKKNESLRGTKQSSAQIDLLKLDLNDNVLLPNVKISATAIEPTSNTVTSLGSDALKFKDLTLSGDIKVDGLVDSVDVAALKATVDALTTKVGSLIPIGTIFMDTKASVPDANWLLCNGDEVSINDYPDLHAKILNTFGTASTGKFRLPDLRTRTPIGTDYTTNVAIGTSDDSTVSNRSIAHSHTSGTLKVALADHTHDVAGHYHEVNKTISNADTNYSKRFRISSSGTHTTNIKVSFTGKTGDWNGTNTSFSTGVAEGAHKHLVRGYTVKTGGKDVANVQYNPGMVTSVAGDGSTTDTFVETFLQHSHPVDSGWYPGRHSHSIDIGAMRVDGGAVNDPYQYRKFLFIKEKTDGSYTYPKSQDYKLTLAGGEHEHTTDNNNTNNSLYHLHRINFYTGNTNYISSTFCNDYYGYTPNSTLNGSNECAHTHTIKIPETTFTDNVGTHSHDNTNFEGRLGKITGESGDADITTTKPSSTTDVTPTGSTGVYTQPHLVVNFIIKAKNG